MVDRNSKKTEIWYADACDLIVREGLSLREAAQENGVGLTIDDAEKHFRRKSFQKTLWLVRNKFYKELATDPNRTKQSLIGLMWLASQKLAESGNWDKVAESLRKLAQVEGYVGPDTQTNVFAQLSQKDMDEIKKRLKAPDEPGNRSSFERTSEARLATTGVGSS